MLLYLALTLVHVTGNVSHYQIKGGTGEFGEAFTRPTKSD